MPQVNDFCWLMILIRVMFIFFVFFSFIHYSILIMNSRSNIFKNLVYIII